MSFKRTIAAVTASGVAALGLTTAGAGAASAATTCTTSAQYGQCGPYDDGAYTIKNNMWNESPSSTQTLTASSQNAWSITGSDPDADNSVSPVKTYPEDEENFSGPLLYDTTVLQNFALSAVPTCTADASWEVAADNWVNATPGGTDPIEVMVWENVCNQYPAGSNTGKTITINGQTFDLYAKTGTDPTYTLVSTTNVKSGVVHDLDIFNWLESLGYFSNVDSLAQLNMGVEIVSTNGAGLTWTFTTSNNSVVSSISG